MSAGKKVLIGILVIILLVLATGIGTYNGLVDKASAVEEAQASIAADLQRRADLIPNLAETVKANAAHETEVFTAITDAREKLVNASASGDMNAASEANAALDAALGKLVVIAEAYPELKSSESYQTLMTQLEGSENRISVSRKDYNAAVKALNTALKKFPGNLFAGMFGFEAASYFEAAAGADEVPDVAELLT